MFKYLSNKIINLQNHCFVLNYDSSDNIFPIIKTFFIQYINNPHSFINKYYFFKTTYDSFFLNENAKTQFSDLFCKIQKTKFSFEKFAFLWKYKKAKHVVQTDMALNEIHDSQKNIICIHQDGSKYLFNIKDLINIINTSLTNSYIFFAEPVTIKNPFNNIPFNKSTLYNIYFYIKFNTDIYPELIFKFFQCNFDLTNFLYEYEPLLRDYSIKNYATKSPNNIIHREIMNMIQEFNEKYYQDENKIIIDKEFPVKRLIKIMKPYLLLYIKAKYSLIPIIRERVKRELNYKMLRFQNFNRQFGKKNMVFKYDFYQTSAKKLRKQFNEKHPHFNETINFMNNHIEVNLNEVRWNIDTETNSYEDIDDSDESEEVDSVS